MERTTLKYVFLCFCPALGITSFGFFLVKWLNGNFQPIYIPIIIVLSLIRRFNRNFYNQFDDRGVSRTAIKRAFGSREEGN